MWEQTTCRRVVAFCALNFSHPEKNVRVSTPRAELERTKRGLCTLQISRRVVAMGPGVLLLGKAENPEERNWSHRAIFVFLECGSCRPAAPLALGAAYAGCRRCAQLRLPWCYVIKETGARRPPARKTRRKTVRARKRSFRFVICVFWLFHRTRRTCECAREFSRVRVCLLARGRAEE